ncbi:thiolase family protein [Bosea sp. (in: a-proteobacteria)]|uniref:thiolase family protein n=1 Tax=Bosea sp. (in: a-proteobacteria) TaxID=1871050 RepID=UPI0026306423|nr:thiolase family protein [Bosea sp. (in: a-proteobacteria)]MCO5089463.1 thiolase family protein [Bosea sp. (in: a-proteobacteria)]
MNRLSRVAAVIGVGHSDWVGDWARVRAGERPDDNYGYGASAFRNALADAGIDRSRINGLIVGPTTAYERMAEVLNLNVRWGDQADAVLSVIQAVTAIESGLADVVALVYGNDQRSVGTQYGGPQAMGGDMFLSYVYHAPWGMTSQGALYALMFRRFCELYGVTERDLGHVAVAQREGSSRNPNAIMRKTISIEDYMAAPYIVEPLRLFDYCLINDGGVALILAEANLARRLSGRPVFVEAVGRYDLNQGATSLEPRLTEFYRPAQQAVAEQIFGASGLDRKDIDVLQVYDSFSVHVPLALEGYGYCGIGESGKFMRESGIGLAGALPTNTGGGHLSESYMQGWNHQIECVRQVRGECGDRQVPDCRRVHYCSDVAGKAVSIIYGA